MNAMGVLIYVIIILVAIMLRILFASIMNGVFVCQESNYPCAGIRSSRFCKSDVFHRINRANGNTVCHRINN